MLNKKQTQAVHNLRESVHLKTKQIKNMGIYQIQNKFVLPSLNCIVFF